MVSVVIFLVIVLEMYGKCGNISVGSVGGVW